MRRRGMEHEKAGNLVSEMQQQGIQPNAITYSTIISIWGRAGKLDRAAMLFQKLRRSGVEIDPVLYQTMIIIYERARLVVHAKSLLHDLKHPENIPMETAITILAKAGRVEEAAWVFRQAVEAGEVKGILVFRCMIDLFAKNKKHKNLIEVFDRMRAEGYFPDSEMIGTVMNAYGKLQEYEMADVLYREMQEEGYIFSDRVHFQMLSLLGARRDFRGVELLLETLSADPNIDKKELHLVAASIYERANKLDEVSRIIGRIGIGTTSNASIGRRWILSAIRGLRTSDHFWLITGKTQVWFCGLCQYDNLFGTSIRYTITASINATAVMKANCFHKKGHNADCSVSNNIYMMKFGVIQIFLSQLPNFHDL